MTTTLHPILAPSVLKSHLLKAGIEALQIDASIEVVHHFLALPTLQENLEAGLRRMDRVQQRVRDRLLRLCLRDEHRQGTISANRLIDQVAAVRTPSGFNVGTEGFTETYALLSDALVLSSFAYYPTLLAAGYVRMSPYHVGQDKYDAVLPYYREVLVPRVAEYSPDVVGISLLFNEQIAPGASLARCLKEQGINSTIVYGGPAFTQLCHSLVPISERRATAVSIDGNPRAQQLFPLLGGDYGVQGEGEEALVRLCKAIERGDAIDDIPNVLKYDPDKQAVAFNAKADPLPRDEFLVPDLSDLPLGEKYFSPFSLALAYTSRGCYWNKCAFCNFAYSMDSRFRIAPDAMICETFRTYTEQYGVDWIGFVDEAVAPKTLRRLPQLIADTGVTCKYSVVLRFDRKNIGIVEAAAASGLRYADFGLESASQRVLCKMDKGYSIEEAKTILKQFAAADVGVGACVMFGFPTETHDEAKETLAFLDEHQSLINAITVSPYNLVVGSPVESHMEDFHVVAEVDPTTRVAEVKSLLPDTVSHEEAKRLTFEVMAEHPYYGSRMYSQHIDPPVSLMLTPNEYFHIERECRGSR
jgi:radical SAM superfamily enzyme YgiQ (UPF0313 family)